jgi:uncharacterized membrane protein
LTPGHCRKYYLGRQVLRREGTAIGKERLAAFSDGVIAIIITIMVLELAVPHGAGFGALRPLIPVMLSYVLSFVYVGIYWNNHHHLLAVTERVRGAVLWANMHLLFWLSLVPFVTSWMGENRLALAPTVTYGVVLFGAAIAFWILQATILKTPGQNPTLAAAIGHDPKGKLSPVLYLIAVCCAFFHPWIADVVYVVVALIWLIPDSRIERAFFGKMDKDNSKPSRPQKEDAGNHKDTVV